jgi:hypothetical protein
VNRSFFKRVVAVTAAFVLVSFVTACASVKPPGDIGNFPRETYAGEDINGYFPETIHIKTRTQTFNTYHYYLIQGERIWYKSINPQIEPKDWVLFEKTGLPHNSRKRGFQKTSAVVEISADADELVALSAEGGFYRYCFDKTIAHKSNVWLDRQGWPNEEPLYLNERIAKNRAWAMGKRNMQVLYYEDPFGNQHHNGTMEIATTYVLLEDGQEIAYADPGLPSDFSRNYAGPERGAFKAVSLSASASTMFLINEAGEMYTRIADFDIVGGDPMFFKYTYIPYTSNTPGANYFSNLTEWGLPPEDWRIQPRIPLSGKAAITRYITILQNGQGNGARELRVAGLNEQGETGYWTKAIFTPSWKFKTVRLYFPQGALLQTAESEVPDSTDIRGERGQSPDKRYSGYWWNNNEKEDGWGYEISNFNILEGDCDFLISHGGEICVVKLHPVELWTFIKRDYLPGRNGPPKMFFVTLDIPENAFDGLSEPFTRRLRQKFAKKDKVLFQYSIAASTRYIFMRDMETDSVLFLTDGTLSDYLPEFRSTWYIENYDELNRYLSPELVVSDYTGGGYTIGDYTIGELEHKIEMNKIFRRELKEHISLLRKNKFSALQLDMIYLPLHYFVRFSPLRFIDLPKMKTMTTHGDKVVLSNSAYIDLVSNTGIWIDERILELLETRISYYEDRVKQLERGREEETPGQFSETISGYWDIAGLPHNVAGTFYTPSSTEQIPATLTFGRDEDGQDYFGWYFAIGEFAIGEFAIGEFASGDPGTEDDISYAFFIDPRKSAKTIYSRGGKTPEQRTVQLDCTIYVNPGIKTAIGQNVADRSLKPFIMPGRNVINVRITFDGNIFEIREHPAAHAHTLIFRGKRLP